MLEERKTLYRKLDDGKIDKKELRERMKKGELNREITPVDLLFKYGTVYHVDLGDRGMVTEVPKEVRDIEERLGLEIFPKVVRS